MDFVRNKLGIMITSMKKDVIGTHLVGVHGKANRAIYKVDYRIKAITKALKQAGSDLEGFYSLARFDVVSGPFRTYEDFGESCEDVMIIKVPDMDSIIDDYDNLDEFLSSQIDTWCQHEYDCCGHWYSTYWSHKTKHLFGNYYIIFVGSVMNV